MRGKDRKRRTGGKNNIAHPGLMFRFRLKRSSGPPLSPIVAELCFKKIDPVRWTEHEIPLAISGEVVRRCRIERLQAVLFGLGELGGDTVKVRACIRIAIKCRCYQQIPIQETGCKNKVHANEAREAKSLAGMFGELKDHSVPDP